VRALLAGGRVDMSEVSTRLGYELRRTHLAFIVYGDGSFPDMERVALSVADSRAVLTVPQGGHLACWVGQSDLAVPDDCPLHVAVGLPGAGVEGFRRSHLEASLARRAAEVLGLPGPVRFDDVCLDVLLTQDAGEARRFVVRELGPLADGSDMSRRLVATLSAFYEEGSSFVRAARRLGVHENTVTYRVQRAEELLGHPVSERRLELQVALRLAGLASS
jgi:PucR C-terminal helix-turn-helix domain/GGDEF-like domain